MKRAKCKIKNVGHDDAECAGDVAAAILAAVEPGILPGGTNVAGQKSH
jgi:hypothetical protein